MGKVFYHKMPYLISMALQMRFIKVLAYSGVYHRNMFFYMAGVIIE